MHRRLGGPLPRPLANAPRANPHPGSLPLPPWACTPRGPWGISRRFQRVLVAVSSGYPPDAGMSLTCYAPFRRSPSGRIATSNAAPRLACVKPAASVHPEPGSNSSLYICLFLLADPACSSADRTASRPLGPPELTLCLSFLLLLLLFQSCQ